MIPYSADQTQMRLLQRHRRFAMQVWDPELQVNRVMLHPGYMARRRAESSNLLKHVLGTLAVLGALVMMAKT